MNGFRAHPCGKLSFVAGSAGLVIIAEFVPEPGVPSSRARGLYRSLRLGSLPRLAGQASEMLRVFAPPLFEHLCLHAQLSQVECWTRRGSQFSCVPSKPQHPKPDQKKISSPTPGIYINSINSIKRGFSGFLQLFGSTVGLQGDCCLFRLFASSRSAEFWGLLSRL